jgi:hypothetical protein
MKQRSHQKHDSEKMLGDKMSRLKMLTQRIEPLRRQLVDSSKIVWGIAPYYIPGALLIAMAGALLVEPRAFVLLASALVLYCGISAIVLAKRIKKIRDTLGSVVKQVEARVYLKDHREGTLAQMAQRHQENNTEIHELEQIKKDTLIH